MARMMMVNGKLRVTSTKRAGGGSRSAAVKKSWQTRKRGGGPVRKLADAGGLRDRANFAKTRRGMFARLGFVPLGPGRIR